jgi:hypothetical protein
MASCVTRMRTSWTTSFPHFYTLDEKRVDIGRLTTIYIQLIRDLDSVSCVCASQPICTGRMRIKGIES